jgi:hypothetical protein
MGKRYEHSRNKKICFRSYYHLLKYNLNVNVENENKALQKTRIKTIFRDLRSACGSPSCDVTPTSHGISHKAGTGFFMILMGLSCSRGFLFFGTTSSSTGTNGYVKLAE